MRHTTIPFTPTRSIQVTPSSSATRALVAFAFALLLPAVARAQGNLYVGRVQSDITGADQALDTRNGWAFGAGIGSIGLGPFLSLAPEAFYFQKGARPTVIDEDDIEDIRVAYLDIQILGRLAVPIPGLPVRPWLVAGPYLAWQVDCSFAFADGGDRSQGCPLNALREVGIDGPFSNDDQGYAYGGGLDVAIPRIGVINLGIRFSQSFGKVIDGETESSPKHKTRMISIGLSSR